MATGEEEEEDKITSPPLLFGVGLFFFFWEVEVIPLPSHFKSLGDFLSILSLPRSGCTFLGLALCASSS